MATKIVTKNSSTASAVPTASDLVQGELAVNVADKRLFTEDNAGAIVELGTNPSSLTVSGNIDVDGVTNLDAVDIDGAVDMASTLQVDGAATFTTEITANGGIALGDNDKATFGDAVGGDLQIYHDGSNSIIEDTSTGNLQLITNGNAIALKSSDGDAMVSAIKDGDVKLYFNNNQKLATTSTGIDVTGTVTADGVEVDGLLHIDGSDNSNVASFALTRTDASWSIDNETNFRIYGNTGDTTNPATKRFEIGTGGDITFYEDTGTTPKLFWDASAESLGIGTSSPSSFSSLANNLVVNSSTNAGITISESTGSGSSNILFAATSGFANRGNISYDHTATAMTFGINATERMRIDSSGSLLFNGNGVVSVQSNSSNFYLGGGSYSPSELYLESGALTAFKVNGTERMRIDSSGNLLVGTTSVQGAGGVTLSGAGYVYSSRPSSTAIYADRTGSDGAIQEFRKAGTTVGSIGTAGGDMYVGTGDTNVRFDDGTDQIYPVNSDGSHRDAAVGLGWSGGRFKDLYLSGGVKGNNLTFRGDGSSEHARIDTSGNLLVGKTNTSIGSVGHTFASDGEANHTCSGGAALYLNRQSSFGNVAQFYQNNDFVGSISVTSTATTYNTSSDQRLKENIADADDAGSKIDAIQVRQYDWKADGSHQDYGMIAQELQTVAPEAVSGDADSEEMMGVDYSKLVPMLIKEIQSLRNRVAQLEE